MIMDPRVSALWLVLLSLLGGALSFQDKAPVQTSLVTGQARNDKQQQILDDTLGTSSGRGIDDHLLKTIEEQQQPRQYGYGPPPAYSPWLHAPHPPRPQLPPWGPPPGPPPPQPPYYGGYPSYPGWGGGYQGGYPGWGGGGYPGYPGYGYPSYPGYPYYPFYRSAGATEVDNQVPGGPELPPSPHPGVFQGRQVLTQNYLEGRANAANIVPLYHLLQMSRA
ncbi:histone-lysine N-methyltransferase SETD1A isoform X2 [Drosophila obscura]|uniref:histone-lysine N-methyltransferase SETD1A isoform X2 n=1 Tax=Drosophila obscura TaxID=7282 RepID=UPI001BB1A6E3|nr:histone-lysine N-methyltransferase SETD1A isoform X2 [Drosophila obscura]